MELNQKSLRGILEKITLVNKDFIVPKQGNWWNPQESSKADTWCAYIIRSNTPRTVPFYTSCEDDGRINSATVLKIATIDLQFVGLQAEEIAQSVVFWPLRSDVQEAFESVHGSIMNDRLEAVSSNFYQDGNNTVLAWNVTIKVLWYHLLATGQTLMPDVDLGGKVKRTIKSGG